MHLDVNMCQARELAVVESVVSAEVRECARLLPLGLVDIDAARLMDELFFRASIEFIRYWQGRIYCGNAVPL